MNAAKAFGQPLYFTQAHLINHLLYKVIVIRTKQVKNKKCNTKKLLVKDMSGVILL